MSFVQKCDFFAILDKTKINNEEKKMQYRCLVSGRFWEKCAPLWYTFQGKVLSLQSKNSNNTKF